MLECSRRDGGILATARIYSHAPGRQEVEAESA